MDRGDKRRVEDTRAFTWVLYTLYLRQTTSISPPLIFLTPKGRSHGHFERTFHIYVRTDIGGIGDNDGKMAIGAVNFLSLISRSRNREARAEGQRMSFDGYGDSITEHAKRTAVHMDM